MSNGLVANEVAAFYTQKRPLSTNGVFKPQ
jgi:hypothetical protein